jgi:hypothetical protein
MTSLLPNPDHQLVRELRACQSKSRRNGKVARLPAELRNQINQMLDDGIPYKIIIERLGDAGKHINEDKISNWRLGGYQDYLKGQAINDRARCQTEAAVDLIREEGHLDPVQANRVCAEIATLHYMEILMQHGEQIALDSLKKNPAKMITLCNALCNMANTGLAYDKLRALDSPPSHQETTLAPNPPEPVRT